MAVRALGQKFKIDLSVLKSHSVSLTPVLYDLSKCGSLKRAFASVGSVVHNF